MDTNVAVGSACQHSSRLSLSSLLYLLRLPTTIPTPLAVHVPPGKGGGLGRSRGPVV
jgi:hypothetical protein